MSVIVCTDIFGKSAYLQTLLDEVGLENRCEIVDPYGGASVLFADEPAAYEAFKGAGGLESYIDVLTNVLLHIKSPVTVLGFSAGASAAYVAMNQMSLAKESRLLGFYPGQIRHYLGLKNVYPCVLVFPQQERHFDLLPVCQSLRNQPHLAQRQTEYQHGFMNPVSQGFSPQGYEAYRGFITSWLNQSGVRELEESSSPA